MNAPLRLLTVDDTPLLKLAMEKLLPHVERAMRTELDLDFSGAYEGAVELAERGRVWDVAFVDLDLGVGRHGGLSTLDLLAAQPNPPRTVVFTEAYDPKRTLTLLSSFAWFDVAGVMNKIGSFTDDEGMVEDFADLLAGVVGGSAARRWIPPHCGAPGVDVVFKDLLPTGTWYRNFRAMRAESSPAAAAEVLRKSESTVRQLAGQVVTYIPGLWQAISLALERGDRPESTVFREQIEAYTRDLDGVNKAYPVCHNFARAQELFFLDPYVERRADLPPRGFHHRGPISSFKP